MDSSSFPALAPLARHAVPYVAAVAIGVTGLGYAAHEHNKARNLAAQDAQMTAQLSATHSQLDALAARVNALSAAPVPTPAVAAQPSEKPSPAVPANSVAARRRVVSHRGPSAQELRFKKLQSQVDQQGQEIEAERSDLAGTRTELSGAIAKTHGELVALERKGERSYFEFDIVKAKEFSREGPLSVKLKKANEKHQYADLMLIVEDRNLTQKHVNLYQPVMFYRPDSPQPMEIVIDRISKNHIHGYVSAPKYRQSELAAMTDQDGNPVQGTDQAANPSARPGQRQKLPLPSESVPQ